MIYENLLVSEEPGKTVFRDFLQDEKRMAALFEAFIRNFYKIEFPTFSVKSEVVLWDLVPLDDISKALLPRMMTDISVESEDSKVVIDAKYYKNALVTYHQKKKVRSNHLYQIDAYLNNLETKGGVNEVCSGILLYPTVGEQINATFDKGGRKIMVRTIQLNQDWKGIHEDLKELLLESLQDSA